jgi:dTMP kinase
MKTGHGIFITFEGIDGCGKSTHAELLYRFLKKSGYDVILLREPGGTPLSERTRSIVLDPRLDISPVAELFLYEAARAQLTETYILPALAGGKIVLCDRFYDSTTAYQGFGRGIDLKLISQLNRVASHSLTPDLTYVFDVDYKTSLKRRGKNPDRLEKEKRAFFKRVRDGFITLAAHKRVRLIDSHSSIEVVFAEVQWLAQKLIARKKVGRAR